MARCTSLGVVVELELGEVPFEDSFLPSIEFAFASHGISLVGIQTEAKPASPNDRPRRVAFSISSSSCAMKPALSLKKNCVFGNAKSFLYVRHCTPSRDRVQACGGATLRSPRARIVPAFMSGRKMHAVSDPT